MDPEITLGMRVAVSLKDYLQNTDFSDFASFYWKKSRQGSFYKTYLTEFIEAMSAADIYPFTELKQQLNHLQMTGLVQLISNSLTPWLFENDGPKPKMIQLLKSIGLEAWLLKPANRVMYILPEKMDIGGCLSQFKVLEEVDMLDATQASSNIDDWERL